jgi:hypothetical protein
MGRVRCLNCSKVIESKTRHDFQTCGCSNQTFVDGGNDYLRCGGANLDMIEVLPDVDGALIALGEQ